MEGRAGMGWNKEEIRLGVWIRLGTPYRGLIQLHISADLCQLKSYSTGVAVVGLTNIPIT